METKIDTKVETKMALALVFDCLSQVLCINIQLPPEYSRKKVLHDCDIVAIPSGMFLHIYSFLFQNYHAETAESCKEETTVISLSVREFFFFFHIRTALRHHTLVAVLP